MGFFKDKLSAVFIIVMLIVCMIAFFISVKVSVTMIEKRNQMVRQIPANNVQKAEPVDKPASINVGRLADQALYINGEKINDMNAYATEKNFLLIPLNIIFKKLGMEFKYYASDDIVRSDATGQNLVLKLGKSGIQLDGRKIKLGIAPQAAKDSILVPEEVFHTLKGFTVSYDDDRNAAFVNYYPGYVDDINSNLKVYKITDGVAEITDITGNKAFWESDSGLLKGDRMEYPDENGKSIVKSAKNVYLIDNDRLDLVSSLDIDPSATFSSDGRYLYWIDYKNRTSYVYSIAEGVTRELGDYFFRLHVGDEDGELPGGGRVLYDYSEGAGYKRVSLANTAGTGVYTFIERNGRLVVKGNVFYSPDRKKIIVKNSKGCSVVNTDGTDMVFLGNEAKWINNNRIFVTSDKESFLTDKNGKSRTKTGEIWKMAGQTLKGDVFYSSGNTLYCETGGKEKEVARLSWNFDDVYAASENGPFIIVSRQQDTVFLLKGEKVTEIGSYYQLLRSSRNGEINLNPDQSVVFSGDGGQVALGQREGGFILLNIIDSGSMVQKKFTLDYDTYSTISGDGIRMKWINNNRLLVYSYRNGWIIDMRDGGRIHSWTEKKGSTIRLILP